MKGAKLTINLLALQNNAKYLVDNIKRNSTENNNGVIAMVKNNAYNLGLCEAVESFYDGGIRFFATTSIKECKAIRDMYSDVHILCVNPNTEFDFIREYGITATLPSFEYIQENHEKMKDISWHIEWAGHMRRSGCRSETELRNILEFAKSKGIEIEGLWTHFSWADTFDKEKTYEKERDEWIALLKNITKDYSFKYIHSQNSASFSRDGILPNHTHIRPGILLYGYYPHDRYENDKITPSIELSGEVISIIKLSAGESIGYCSSFVPTEDTLVAVVNLGYGDGLLRKRGIGHDVIINDKKYKLVSFMMSHTVVKIDEYVNMEDSFDASEKIIKANIENSDVKVGDTVYYYNKELPLHEFTKKGVGSCSEQMSPLNYSTLEVEYIR